MCAEGHPLQGCFLCQEAPRVLLHVYEGLPNLDWQSCENGHHQSSMDTAHTRCDWCRLTINKIAAKTPAGGQCDAATNMFDRSCARADHYNGDPTSDSFALTSLPGGCHADDRCHKQPASRIQCQLAHRWPCLLRFRGRVTRWSNRHARHGPEDLVYHAHSFAGPEHQNPESRHPCRHFTVAHS